MKQTSGYWLTACLGFALSTGMLHAAELKIGLPIPEGTKEWKAATDAAKRIAKERKVTIIQTLRTSAFFPCFTVKKIKGSLCV